MNKTLIILLSFFMTFLMILVPLDIPIVKATQGRFGFEDDNVNGPYTHTYNNIAMATTWESGKFEIELNPRTGLQSFYIGATTVNQFWNYTQHESYEPPEGVLTNFSFYIYRNSGIYLHFCLFNKTQLTNGDNALTDSFIHIWVNGQSWDYYDHNNNPQDIGSKTADTYTKFYIGIDGNNSIDYGIEGAGGMTSINNVPPQNNTFNNTFMKMDTVRFSVSGTPLLINIDDHIFETGSVYGEQSEGEGTGPDYNDKNSIGQLICTGQTLGGTHNIIEFPYYCGYNGFNGTIQGFDLLVDTGQYTGQTCDPNPNNYYLYINGDGGWQCDYFFEYSDECYIMRWTALNYDAVAEEIGWTLSTGIKYGILYELYHYNSNPALDSWHLTISDTDLDLDGSKITAYHSNVGWLNGYSNFPDWINKQTVYKIYYDKGEIIPRTFDDNIIINDGIYYTYEPVYYTCSFSTIDVPNVIYIYGPNEVVRPDGWQFYPRVIRDQYIYGNSFVPMTWGTWNVSFKRNDVFIKNASVNVINTTDNINYQIRAFPNPAAKTSEIKVEYNYTHATDEGSVWWNYEEIRLTTGNFLKSIGLSENSSFSFSETYYDIIYWLLTRNNNSIVDSFPQSFYDSSTPDGRIWVLYNPFRIGVYNNQVYYYSHKHPTATVVIKQNGEIIHYCEPFMSVGDRVRYDHPITLASSYNVTLEIIGEGTDNDNIVLSQTEFIANYDDESQPSSFPKIEDAKIGAILGAITVIGFLLIPMIIPLAFGFSPSDVPSIAYLLAGSTGAAFAIYMGFFDLWVVFFIVVVGIIWAVIMYFRG